jgi:hypothetical protein
VCEYIYLFIFKISLWFINITHKSHKLAISTKTPKAINHLQKEENDLNITKCHLLKIQSPPPVYVEYKFLLNFRGMRYALHWTLGPNVLTGSFLTISWPYLLCVMSRLPLSLLPTPPLFSSSISFVVSSIKAQCFWSKVFSLSMINPNPNFPWLSGANGFKNSFDGEV